MRYFKCVDGYGLFVSLSRLIEYTAGNSYSKPKSYSHQGENPSYASVAGKDIGSPAQNTHSKSNAAPASVMDSPSAVQIGERVCFHDKNGKKYTGVVRWTGKSTRTRSYDCSVVGIQTVSLDVLTVGTINI